MAKINYADKVAINIDPTIPDINKCKADDMNEIKNVVNENENKTLIAISSTAPSQCTTGDLYFNTTSKKIFTATATDTWSSTGEDPTENTLYLYDNTIYSYDGTTLVAVGGGTEIAISTTQPSGDEVLWINPDEVPTGQGSYISNEYGSSQEIGYSQEYVNNHFGKTLWTGSFTSGSINVPDLDKYKIIGIVADSVFCIGNKNFGGGIYGIYGGTGNGIVSYRLSNSGTTLSINSNDKGAYNNGTQVAITDVIGIM